ncbi:winged helix-turn-helix transcriptional regulator [Siansivirga zeaxanthinifaciens]|uniref:Transcriptional regulator n=1 Tax=Siansivirga zeaxanthinifaciens CC-SAMT-1 TaxID=1454006 RepID=A0A0C5VVU7_9FLAO|nr:helix-turn-helix domain-containing protein [Siansivirga zeaxanthinifaciens]AJR03221.1 transcriptional regulator [Siansivirga zeaxanthinifaciens CC-SAMT-1]
MKNNFRSGCPLASTLDIVGDKWSLLIVRDMLFQVKKTFKDFSTSPEGIAPGILSSRLKWLEENQLITKQKLPDNKKENIYLLTEKGIELAPIITEIILWSDKNLRGQNAEMFSIAEAGFHQDKSKFTEGIQKKYMAQVNRTVGKRI